MFPFRFELGDSESEVRLGPWALRRIRYDDIESVRLGHSVWCEKWCNFWPLFEYVTIRRKSGWIKDFVVNPANPAEFIRALKQKAFLP